MELAGPGKQDEKASLSAPVLVVCNKTVPFSQYSPLRNSCRVVRSLQAQEEATQMCAKDSVNSHHQKKPKEWVFRWSSAEFSSNPADVRRRKHDPTEAWLKFKFLGEKMVFCSTKFCSTLLHDCIRHLSRCGNKSWQKPLKEGKIYLAHSSKERSLPRREDMVAGSDYCVYCQETEKDGR